MKKNASVQLEAWGGDAIAVYFNLGDTTFGVDDKTKLTIYRGYTEDFGGEDADIKAPSWGFHLVTADSSVTAKVEGAMQRKNEVQLIRASSEASDLWVSMLAYKSEFSELLDDLLSQCKSAGLKIKSTPFKTYKPSGTFKGYKIKNGTKITIRR